MRLELAGWKGKQGTALASTPEDNAFGLAALRAEVARQEAAAASLVADREELRKRLAAAVAARLAAMGITHGMAVSATQAAVGGMMATQVKGVETVKIANDAAAQTGADAVHRRDDRLRNRVGLQ